MRDPNPMTCAQRLQSQASRRLGSGIYKNERGSSGSCVLVKPIVWGYLVSIINHVHSFCTQVNMCVYAQMQRQACTIFVGPNTTPHPDTPPPAPSKAQRSSGKMCGWREGNIGLWHLSIYLPTYLHIYRCVYMHHTICTCMYLHLCVYAYTYTYMYMHTCIRTYLFV